MWLHVYASKVGVEFTALAWGSVRDEEAAEKAEGSLKPSGRRLSAGNSANLLPRAT